MPDPPPAFCLPPARHRSATALLRPRGGALLTSLVVLAVLTLTGLTAWNQHAHNTVTDNQRFEVIQTRLHDEILRRVKIYRYGLNGTRSIFATSKNLDRQGFRRILEVRDLDEEFPAAAGLGYIDRVAAPQLEDYLTAARADGAPDFALHTLSGSEVHDDHFVIRFIEPIEYNRTAMGLDIGSEPRRRAAAQHAMATGDIAITEKITLDQTLGGAPGFLILLPHYASDMPLNNRVQREAALEGWIYMGILAERLFAGVGDMGHGEVDFKVFDSVPLTLDQLIYDDSKSLVGATQDQLDQIFDHQRHHSLVNVAIGGQHWRVAMSSTPQFRAASTSGVWMTAGAGILLAALLALLLENQSTSLRRALALAQTMTADLRSVALTDRLTGLPNRAAVIPLIQGAINQARHSTDHHYAVLFIDLDRFKAVNDTLGHGAGDELLVTVADRLHRGIIAARNAGGLGTQSTAARLGGDEFLLLLDGLPNPSAGGQLADRLLGEITEPCNISGREVCVGASIGVLHGSAAYFSAEEMVRDADTAMYEAKGRGSGGCLAFDVSMRTRITDRLRIESDLRGAIDRREFFLDYQPIVCLKTGVVETVEALVRWRHPELGVLSPDVFIGVAEETGIIVPLGAWVLDEALAQLARWRRISAESHPTQAPGVSVNLSRKQLILPELPSQVLEAMSRHGTDPADLHLEVTESQIMENRDMAIGSLRRLREAGVRIAIDDFGTGHSSLACLHAFPTDVLKIDRAFVANLDRDPNLVALLRSVTEMARTLGKRVVAEGIETDAQHRLLSELACDLGQGYRFSRPIAPEHVLAFCRERTQLKAA